MPQRQKVPSLQSLCLRNVGFTVERMAKKITTNVNVEEYVQKTRDYLNEVMTCVPRCLHEHIAIEVLDGVRRVVLKKRLRVKKMNILGRINETVLNPQLKKLEISVWPRNVTPKFYPNMQNLKGLEKLELASLPETMRTKEFYEYLSVSISAMKKLKSFIFTNTCTDDIVKAIAYHCRDIQYLELEGSHSVTDRSIPLLLFRCSKLKILKIAETGITSDGMTQLIMGLPNLLEVDYHRFDLVVECLKNFNCGPFGLRKAELYYELKGDLNFFLDMFPKMEYFVFHRPNHELPLLASLVNLNTLVVLDIYDDYLKQLLKLKGRNITSLVLDCAVGVDIQHIIDIGLYCPNLTSLGLVTCEFTDCVMPSGRFDEPLFTNLRKVHYVGNGGMGILEFVLSHAFDIRVIDVTYIPDFPPDITHSFVEKVLHANPMKNLEEFSVSKSTELNMRTVELLLENCLNLRVLSGLEEWTEIGRKELRNFKEYISSQNFNLQYVCSPHPTEW